MAKIQMTEEQAEIFIDDCLFFANEAVIQTFKNKLKSKGYMKQNPVEEAKDLINSLLNTAWEANYYEKHKDAIIEFNRQRDILIRAIEYLEAQK